MIRSPAARPDGRRRAVGDAADPPVVVVLTPHWEHASEEGWVARQVAGALACGGDVHVVTPGGRRPSQSVDSVFTVHELGTPIPKVAEVRRDVLLDALAAVGIGQPSGPPVPAAMDRELDRDLAAPWLAASDIVADLRPDHVVIAGHQNLGALRIVDRSAPGVPVTLVALGSDLASLASGHFAPVFDRADSILTTTEVERATVIAAHGAADRTVRVGPPHVADPSARSEPNAWVGDYDYVLVLTDAASDADDDAVDLARLLRLRFPENPVAVVSTDSFSVWHRGHRNEAWAVERRSDLARLMAWARLTVDLRPGKLMARRCIDSLLYGTPIVVPADARAREHAEHGGLWFESPGELVGCVAAFLEPSVREAAGAQGRAYAERAYGSSDAFVEQVLAATRLSGQGAALPA